MLSETEISRLLEPFGLRLDQRQLDQIQIYLELLVRWNDKINLTSIRDPEECVTRHFGESLFLSTYETLAGDLLDIGSGAGFPGLALKIAFQDVRATLLEPSAKKRAFLKEVCRMCSFPDVEVRPERLKEWIGSGQTYDAITARAVGKAAHWVEEAVRILKTSGKIHLWISHQQSEALRNKNSNLEWTRDVETPLSRQRVILTGRSISRKSIQD
ncbi:MAG TPA: 16S rRNA (guanine(527)-N(7))-methyltransferase RsmG [Terriglobia bacterium]|nr:16S rRNA (guanine(527)-N(7))-methyltransferase RsmG [Terriglobia bacterium]